MLVDKDTYNLIKNSNDLNLSSEDVQFLKDLSYELNTQDHVGQANPRFWVIMDYKRDYADGFDGGTAIYDVVEYEVVCEYNNDLTILGEWIKETFEDIVDIKNLEYTEDYVEFECDDHTYNIQYDWDLKMFLEDIEYDKHYQVTGYREEEYIVQNTMFLTLREAQEHIKRNYYHYSDKVHPYAMTAWRSPQVDKLIKILNKINPKEE